MIKLFSAARAAALLLALVGCAASCDRAPAVVSNAPPPATPDDGGITFRKGFYKEESLSPTTVLRWARQDAMLRVEAPGDGRYRLTFRPFTVFSVLENTIEIRIGGETVGKFSTRAFDLADSVPTPVEIPLLAGGNDLCFHSARPETRLGEDDGRLAVFGLLLPITMERVP